MEVPAKRKSLQIHQCGILHDIPIVKGYREESTLPVCSFYTGESCSGPYVRKGPVSSEGSQDALASQLFDSSDGF